MRHPYVRWSLVKASLTRPYVVGFKTAALAAGFACLVPCYVFIGVLAAPGRTLYAPELALDRGWPLQPSWALVYGALYLFLVLVPFFVVRQENLVRRTLLAYVAVWLAAYACFLLVPTRAPRPELVVGDGFAAWGLRFLYSADPPYNCFPSLHVAHSFVSALSCYRVHRGVGVGAAFSGFLVGVSTLYTKQHYVVDMVAGMLLASLAYACFLRGFSRAEVPAADREVAPDLALALIGAIGLAVACLWGAYELFVTA